MSGYCAVFGCYNHRRKTRCKGIRYFRFPRNKAIQKAWIIRCRRKDKFSVRHGQICSAHFHQDDFQDDVKAKILGVAPKCLRKTAVPSLNLPECGSSKSSSSKRKRTSSEKSKETLLKEDVEEKEDGVKKLKVEEERSEEKEEGIEEREEVKPDALDMIPFQEIKIEEEDPLSEPYLLDDEDNIPEAPGVDLPSRNIFKQEHLSWTDKTDQDKNSIAVAEGDSTKKENNSEPSEKAKAVSGSVSKESHSKEKISEGLGKTQKKNPKKLKVSKQQEPSSAEELTRKRCRKILREDSQSELSELSLQLTRDIYDVFGMHVAKTLRDINDIKVFNRVKIKINDILLDALAGYYSNPGFDRETSVGTQNLPQGHKISKNTQPSIPSGDSLNQDLERTHVMKCSSSPKKDIHQTSLDIDQTQSVSIDQSSSISQHSRIPETVRIINQPVILPVITSHSETPQTRTENPNENACQDSRTLETTQSIYQPGTILVNFSFPVMSQSSVVDNSRTLEATESMSQPGTIPVNSFPVMAQSSAVDDPRTLGGTQYIYQPGIIPVNSFPVMAQSSAVDDSRTLEASQSVHQPGTIPVISSCPDTAQSSVLYPNDNSSQHSKINKTSHDTDILARDPNITRTKSVDPPSSSYQHCGLTETAASSVDATQTSTVNPPGSISQHSGIPVTAHDKTHHPQVPGKRKKNKKDLQS